MTAWGDQCLTHRARSALFHNGHSKWSRDRHCVCRKLFTAPALKSSDNCLNAASTPVFTTSKALPSAWEGWFFPSTQPHRWSPGSPSDGSVVWSSQILHCSFIGRGRVVFAPGWPQDVFYGKRSSVFMPVHTGSLVWAQPQKVSAHTLILP